MGQICGCGTKKSGPDGEDGPVSGVVQVGFFCYKIKRKIFGSEKTCSSEWGGPHNEVVQKRGMV